MAVVMPTGRARRNPLLVAKNKRGFLSAALLGRI